MNKVEQGRKNYRYGLWAERLAIILLWIKNYRIEVLRYKRPVGEIDIIARKGQALCFIEVKWRKDSKSVPYAITPSMKKRIHKAAQYYCMENEIADKDYEMRFDAILISPPFNLQHIDNAWHIGDNAY